MHSKHQGHTFRQIDTTIVQRAFRWALQLDWTGKWLLDASLKRPWANPSIINDTPHAHLDFAYDAELRAASEDEGEHKVAVPEQQRASCRQDSAKQQLGKWIVP